jgi:transcriptional regulator with GAF, ATPase, and Fis domain
MSQTATQGQSPQVGGPVAKFRSLVSVADLPPPMSERLRLASAMAEVALSVQEDGLDLGERLQILADGAVDVVPGADCAAIVVPDGHQRLTARAVCGALPPAVVRLQSDLGEGPCLTAVTQTDRVWVPDVARDPRWPRFASRAAALGVQSMICTPLVLGTTILGSLSLGSAAVNAFDEESASLAAIFAAHTTTALAAAEGRRQLGAAISSRDIIGQAKGILMERYQISAEGAFAVLIRTSQNTNVKLHDVAVELCESRTMATLPPRDAVAMGHADGQPQG